MLVLAILISLGGIAYKVTGVIRGMQHEIKKNPRKILDYLPESALHMKDFHRAKVEDGRKVWELFGDEANYYKEQKQAVIKKPRFYYYDRKGEAIETKGNEAHIYLNDKELERMELHGGIQVFFQGYVLESEQANYLPAKDQIVLPGHTTVDGEGMHLEGSRMEIEVESKRVRLIDNVKTKVEPEKLAKKKSKADTSAQIGG